MFKASPDEKCVTGTSGVVCAICDNLYARIDGVCVPCDKGTSSGGIPSFFWSLDLCSSSNFLALKQDACSNPIKKLLHLPPSSTRGPKKDVRAKVQCQQCCQLRMEVETLKAQLEVKQETPMRVLVQRLLDWKFIRTQQGDVRRKKLLRATNEFLSQYNVSISPLDNLLPPSPIKKTTG